MIGAETAGSSVTLRPARPEDCRRVWEWRNERSARAASFNERVIPYEDHEQWYIRKLSDPHTKIFIVTLHGDQPIGYVRFDIDGVSAEISISIDRQERGKGYGSSAIAAASAHALERLRVREIVAHVKTTNPGSKHAFEHAGYTVRKTTRIADIEAWELAYDAQAAHVLRARPRPGAAPKVLFRADADAQQGLGHLQRAISLALALQKVGGNAVMQTVGEPAVARRVERYGLYRAGRTDGPSWSREDLDQTVATAAEHGCGAVVVDSNTAPADFVAGIRRAGLWTCVVTDTAAYSFPCHLVVSGDAHAHRLVYRSATGDTRFLLGPEFAILRPEFWDVHPHAPRASVERILITLGGADSSRLMPELLYILDDVPGTFSVTAVMGPFFVHVEAIQAAAGTMKRPVRLEHDPDEVRDLMLESDLAISGGGQTLYELACAGCPAVAVRAAADQVLQIEAFAAAGVIRPVLVDRQHAADSTRDAVRSLISDREARAAMSKAGRLLVDGRGALRVAEAIMSWAESEAAV